MGVGPGVVDDHSVIHQGLPVVHHCAYAEVVQGTGWVGEGEREGLLPASVGFVAVFAESPFVSSSRRLVSCERPRRPWRRF